MLAYEVILHNKNSYVALRNINLCQHTEHIGHYELDILKS